MTKAERARIVEHLERSGRIDTNPKRKWEKERRETCLKDPLSFLLADHRDLHEDLMSEYESQAGASL